jgi:perosamine synthetase
LIPHSRPTISQAEIKKVIYALRKGFLSQGPEVAALEKEIAKIYKGSEVIVVSSGTAALYLSLIALGITPINKVIIPSYTCNSLYSSVNLAGANAVCADVAQSSVNIDKNTILPLLSKEVKAVIVPHMFGFLANITSIKKLGLPVIEDCAQAVGGRYPDGTLLGSKGDIAILSFFATKLIPAGEGGACITRNHKAAEIIRQLRDCDKKLPHDKAFNFKMTDISASLARAKLKNLESNVRQRSKIAKEFDKVFGMSSFRSRSATPQVVCFRYLVSLRNNIESFLRKAQAAGITCSKPTWLALHHSIGGYCPNAEKLERTLVSVPLYPGLTKTEIERICRILPTLLQ